MGKLTHPIVDTTAVVEQLTAKYQFWTLENPDTNAQSIFYNVNATATTTATQSVPVRPGQKAFFFVNTDENPNGVSLIAATAAQTVNLTRDTFRTRLGYNLAVFAAGVAASVANWWQPLAGSTTVLTMVGGRTTWRAVSGADAIIQNDQGNTGLEILDGANGNAFVNSDGTGLAGVRSSDATDAVLASQATVDVFRNNVNLARWTDTQESHLVGTAPVVYTQDTSFADARHTFNATDRVLHTPSAGGNISSVFDCIELPITNAAVVAVGDMVVWAGGGLINRVSAEVAATRNNVIGVAILGGTGNAGGTVFARIRIGGVLVQALTIDAAGTTAGQMVRGGATTAQRIESQATVEGTFAMSLTGGASAAIDDVFLKWGPTG